MRMRFIFNRRKLVHLLWPRHAIAKNILLFITTLGIISLMSIYIPYEGNCETTAILSKVLSGRSEMLACIPPKLQLWHKGLESYFFDVPPIKCDEGKNWVYVKNGTLKISSDALQAHGYFRCDYTPYIRKDDFTALKGNTIHDIQDGIPLTEEQFSIDCKPKDGKTYTNIHSGIAYKKDIHERPSTLSKNSLGLNILMFGFDSISRMTWMRNLPKSHEYFVKNMGATILEGYNIVGDGTPAALLPILTGKTEQELPEARRGIDNATFVDGHPWIWKEFQKMGYVTQWAEDEPQVGTFQYRMLGFKNKPVDHYMRPFFIEAKKVYDQHKLYCLGSMPRHINMFNYGTDFYDMYPNKPKFSFLFHSEISHEKTSGIRALDEDFKLFLQHINEMDI